MAGHPLAFLPEDAASLVPPSQTVSDHHLVPEGPACLDRRDTCDREIEVGRLRSDVGLNEDRLIWIERGFRARFDSNNWAHIGAVARLDLRVPDEQRLSVGIGWGDLDPAGALC